VRINQAWQHRQATQVVIHWASLWINRDNLRALDHYASVSEHASFAIEHCVRGDYDALLRRHDVFLGRRR
jgi:hypothetical protein